MQARTVTRIRCLFCIVLSVVFLGTLAHAAGKDEKAGSYYSKAQILLNCYKKVVYHVMALLV